MLAQFLTSELFAFLLVFCRVGSALMVMPGFGEAFVSMRVRLLLAFMFSLLLAPVIVGLPAPPTTVFGVTNLIIAEILVGVFIGGLGRILMSAIHVAGMIIAMQSSLASALAQDVTQIQGQASSIGNLLSVSSMVLLFTTDLHHYMLKGLFDSYTLFLPGYFPVVDDFTQHVMQTMSDAFTMALQLSAPHIVVGIIIYLGAGILSRLVPNIQVFFLIMAPQIWLSFFVLMVSISAILMWYMDYFKESLSKFVAP
jgi:flagellar biosynthesis protein FliR